MSEVNIYRIKNRSLRRVAIAVFFLPGLLIVGVLAAAIKICDVCSEVRKAW